MGLSNFYKVRLSNELVTGYFRITSQQNFLLLTKFLASVQELAYQITFNSVYLTNKISFKNSMNTITFHFFFIYNGKLQKWHIIYNMYITSL